jgi:hypothetical protein
LLVVDTFDDPWDKTACMYWWHGMIGEERQLQTKKEKHKLPEMMPSSSILCVTLFLSARRETNKKEHAHHLRAKRYSILLH